MVSNSYFHCNRMINNPNCWWPNHPKCCLIEKNLYRKLKPKSFQGNWYTEYQCYRNTFKKTCINSFERANAKEKNVRFYAILAVFDRTTLWPGSLTGILETYIKVFFPFRNILNIAKMDLNHSFLLCYSNRGVLTNLYHRSKLHEPCRL